MQNIIQWNWAMHFWMQDERHRKQNRLRPGRESYYAIKRIQNTGTSDAEERRDHEVEGGLRMGRHRVYAGIPG